MTDINRFQAWLDAEIIRLRAQRMGDRLISYELGQDFKRINKRRHELGLPNLYGNGNGVVHAPRPFRPSVCKPHDALIRAMAAEGRNNRDIAAACGMGVSRNAVIGWRYRNGI